MPESPGTVRRRFFKELPEQARPAAREAADYLTTGAPSWITAPPTTMMARPSQVEVGTFSLKRKRPAKTLTTAKMAT